MLQEAILAVLVSFDTFLFAAAYRSSNIRIPFLSAVVINSLSAFVLGITLFFSGLLGRFIPEEVCRMGGFIVLVFIGIWTVFKSLLRSLVRKLSQKGDLSLKIGDGGLVMKLYLDDTAADVDCSKILSPGEALTLALASSVDAAAMGISCGCSGAEPLTAAFCTFIAGAAAIVLGTLAGRKIADLSHDLSWLGGVSLIVFAITEILG